METFNIADCIGDQSPTAAQAADPDFSVFFMEPVLTNTGSIKDMAMRRVICRLSRAYYSVDEILEDAQLLPENPGHSVQQLNKHIAMDTMRGFGKIVENYNILAYAGRSQYDKPIASVKRNGAVQYYVNPQFQKMVKKL